MLLLWSKQAKGYLHVLHLLMIMLVAEGPTRSGVEQYEVMDVDEDVVGGDGPGPQRCTYHVHIVMLAIAGLQVL